MISLAEFQENVKKCWRFILDITWDQNRRHPELPRSTCMKERSYLHSLMGTADTWKFGATGGWQGQFVNGRGMLNEAHAAKYLEDGVLPFARRESHCSFEALRQHLNKLGL